MKTTKKWLCVEHGAKFLLSADNYQEAYEGAMGYGGHVIGEYNEQTGRHKIDPNIVWG
jgi:hypothetical protein